MSSDDSISITWEVAENADSLRRLNQRVDDHTLGAAESRNSTGKKWKTEKTQAEELKGWQSGTHSLRGQPNLRLWERRAAT